MVGLSNEKMPGKGLVVDALTGNEKSPAELLRWGFAGVGFSALNQCGVRLLRPTP